LPGVPEDRSVKVHNNTPRTPGLKTLGFFVAQTKVMTETDNKKQREAEFTQQHTLTDEDLRKMILEKYERAKVYNLAVRKREIAHE